MIEKKCTISKLIVILAMIWLLLCSWKLHYMSSSLKDLQAQKVNYTLSNAIHLAFASYSFNNNLSACSYWLKIAYNSASQPECKTAIKHVMNMLDDGFLSASESSRLMSKLVILRNNLQGTKKPNMLSLLHFNDINKSKALIDSIDDLVANINKISKNKLLNKIKVLIKDADDFAFEQLKSIERDLILQTAVSFEPLRVCDPKIDD